MLHSTAAAYVELHTEEVVVAVHREVVELHTEATVVDIVDDMGCTEAAVDIADMDCTSAGAAVVVVEAEVAHMVEGVVVEVVVTVPKVKAGVAQQLVSIPPMLIPKWMPVIRWT
jgi:hypothetical protein